MILNSYFMYLDQFQTGYFTAMRVITIVGGIFSVLALIVFGASFGGGKGDVLMELAQFPMLLFKDPRAFLVYGFPLFAAGTALSSFCFER